MTVCPRCGAEIFIGNRCPKCILNATIADGTARPLGPDTFVCGGSGNLTPEAAAELESFRVHLLAHTGQTVGACRFCVERIAKSSPDQARILRYAASNLRSYANEPFTKDLDAESLRHQASELDEMTNNHPDDWPVVRGSKRRGSPMKPRLPVKKLSDT